MATHICCRDCGFEAVVFEMDAERTIETHEEDEGHTVDSESFEGSKRLETDEAKGIDQGKLEAARSAGAHDEFIAFVAEYPDSRVAETLETAISLDVLDNFPGHAGSFGAALWEHGAKKAANPDSENRRRIEELFDKGRWPTWMQKEASEDELSTDGGRDTLRLTDDGIEIPEDVNLFGGVVFRARGVTVDHKPGSLDLEFYPALEERHLDAEGVSVQNDHLSEGEVSIKPYGKEARTYEVTVPATDGGENEESSPIPLYQREEAVPEDATDLILLLAAENGATYETVREQLEQIEADAMHIEIGNIGGPVRADLGPYAQPKTREPFRSLRLLKSVDYVEEFSQAQFEEGEELTLTEKARQAVDVFRRGMLDEQREALEEVCVETAPRATDGGAREETIQNWLIINWREGTTRTRKSKPDASSLGTHELATSLTLNVTIPEVDVPELIADVEVPQPRVEASELSDLEAEDSPDWLDIADEVVDDNPDADPFEEVDRLVVSVLEDAPGRPDVAEVKRYLRNHLRERQRGESA